MDIHSLDELIDLSENGIVPHSVTIRDGIDTIVGVQTIKGDLGITQRSIVSLGSLEEVTGDLWVSVYDTPCNLSSLGNLKKVQGDLNIKSCVTIDSLGCLESVGGTLNIRNTQIRDFGHLSSIHGDAHLPIEMKECSLGELQVLGKVRYWKFVDQYAPKQGYPTSIITLRHKEIVEGKNLMTGKLAVHFGHVSEFTSFGRANLEQIYPFIESEIRAFIEKWRVDTFLDVFFDGIHPYMKDVTGHFNTRYYRQFYSSDESFEFYDGLYSTRKYDFDDYRPSLVFEHAISEQLSKFFRPAEDAFRTSIGVPKIGEGWVSETDLYYKIKDHFNNYNVIQHGRPSWLGKQHLDIYFPDENIAIEYQGAQHYEPVDFFGGEDGYKKTIERDQRKKQLCQKNGCRLLCVDERDSIDDVIKKISDILNA